MATLNINFTRLEDIIESDYVVQVLEPSLQQLAKPGNKIITYVSPNGHLVYVEIRLSSGTPAPAPSAPRGVVPHKQKQTKAKEEIDFPPIGTLFVQIHSYRAPDIRRIIGYTKNMVITELVPLVVVTRSPGGDSYRIDKDWLDSHPAEDAKISKEARDKFRVGQSEYGYALKKGDQHYGEVHDINHVYYTSEY